MRPGPNSKFGRIDILGNTGAYLDTPYHRFEHGYDLERLPLARASDLAGAVVRITRSEARAIDWPALAATEVNDCAVLIRTGWSRYWRTDAYFDGHPYLTEKAAVWLRDKGALLICIDSLNIDDAGNLQRSVPTILLEAGIPTVKLLTNLSSLPAEGSYFCARTLFCSERTVK